MKKTNKKIVKKKAVKKSNFSYELYNAVKGGSFVRFSSLSALREMAIKDKTNASGVLVYRENLTTKKKTLLSPSKYAYKNKIYNPSKSIDGTGFQYVWGWTKESPFQQEVAVPLPQAYTEPAPKTVVDVIPPKTTWQKIKDGFSNFFKLSLLDQKLKDIK